MLSILIPTLTPISTFFPTTTSFDSPRNLSEGEHINQEEKREWFGKTSGVKGLCYMVQSHSIGYWLRSSWGTLVSASQIGIKWYAKNSNLKAQNNLKILWK